MKGQAVRTLADAILLDLAVVVECGVQARGHPDECRGAHEGLLSLSLVGLAVLPMERERG